MHVTTLVNTEAFVNYSLENFVGTLKLSNFKGMNMKLIYELIEYLCKVRKLDIINVDNGSLLTGNILGGRLKGKTNIELLYKGIIFTESNYKHKVVYGRTSYELTTMDLNKLLGTDILKNKYKKFREYLVHDLKEVIYIWDTKIDLCSVGLEIDSNMLKDLASYYELDTILYDTRFLLKYLNSGYKVTTMLFNFLDKLYSSHISKLNNISSHIERLSNSDINKEIVDSYIDTLSYKDVNLRYSIDSYLMCLLDNLETNKLKEDAIQQTVLLKSYLSGVHNDDIYYIVNNISGTRQFKTKSKDSRLLSKQEVKQGVYGHSRYVDLIDESRRDLAIRLGGIVLNSKIRGREVVYSLEYLNSVLTDLQNIDLKEYLLECKNDISKYDYVYIDGIEEELKSIATTKDYVKELKELKLYYVRDSKLRDLYIENNNDLNVLQYNICESETSNYYVVISKDIISRYRNHNYISGKQKNMVFKYYTFLTDSTLKQCRVLSLFREFIIEKRVKGYYSCLSIVDTILKGAEYSQKQASTVMEFYLEFVSSGKECDFELTQHIKNYRGKTQSTSKKKKFTNTKRSYYKDDTSIIDTTSFSNNISDIDKIL